MLLVLALLLVLVLALRRRKRRAQTSVLVFTDGCPASFMYENPTFVGLHDSGPPSLTPTALPSRNHYEPRGSRDDVSVPPKPNHANGALSPDSKAAYAVPTADGGVDSGYVIVPAPAAASPPLFYHTPTRAPFSDGDEGDSYGTTYAVPTGQGETVPLEDYAVLARRETAWAAGGQPRYAKLSTAGGAEAEVEAYSLAAAYNTLLRVEAAGEGDSDYGSAALVGGGGLSGHGGAYAVLARGDDGGETLYAVPGIDL